MSTIKNVELLKVINKLNKKYGDNTVIVGDQITTVEGRMTTGSLAFDVALGGGWPVNQWNEIIGEESSGKSAIALKTIAANQEKDPEFTSIWVAAEEWVPSYALMCGVDLSRVYVVSTNSMENAYEAVINLAQSKAIDCIVIDSLPALVPDAEDDKEVGEFTVGRGAILTNKFFRKVGTATKRSLVEDERPILGLMINQWREKIGVTHGDNRTSPGGKGKNFAYFTRVDVKRSDWIELGKGDNKVRVGQTIKVRLIKNKSAPPQQVAFMDFYFRDGGLIDRGQYDSAKEIIAMGILNGVLRKSGGWYYYHFNGEERKWQGADKVVASIREEVDLKEKLELDVLDAIKSGSKFVAESEDED